MRAVRDRRREVWVAPSSLKIIVGSMVAPGAWLDRKLAEDSVWSADADALRVRVGALASGAALLAGLVLGLSRRR